MLSIEQCRKHLPAGRFSDKEIEKIRSELYQLANVLLDEYVGSTKKAKSVDKIKWGDSND